VNLTYDQLNGGCTGCLPTPADGTVRYNADNRIAILNPTNPLLPNTEYTAVIEGSGEGDHRPSRIGAALRCPATTSGTSPLAATVAVAAGHKPSLVSPTIG
jgi:hypothetical protein